MEWILIIALLLFLLGTLASWIWLVRLAFIDGRLWGWVVLTVPFGGIVYGILAWREAHRPMLINLGMVLLTYMAYAMLVSTRPQYELHNLYGQVESRVVEWVAALNRPKPWEVDPEVMGEPVIEAQAGSPDGITVAEGEPTDVTDVQPTTTVEPATAPTPTETAQQAGNERQMPSDEPTGTKGARANPLKTRVIRIGAVEVEDRLAPYRALNPQERIARLPELMWQPMVLCLRQGGVRRGTLEELNETTLVLRQRLASGNFDAIVQRKRIRDVLLPRPRQPLSELHCR